MVLTLVVLAGVVWVATHRGDDGTVSGVVVQTDISFGDDRGPLLLDAYLPTKPAATSTPAVIFVQGGSWHLGDKDEWAFAAKDLVTKTGWRAFSVSYVLDSPTPYLDEVADVLDAIEWVKSNAATYGVDPARVGIVGESAGGHLALLAAMSGDGPSSGPTRVRAVVSWSGFADMALLAGDLGCATSPCSTSPNALGAALEGYEKSTLAEDPARWTSTSPVTHVDASDPPTLLIHSADEVVPRNQLDTMAAKLKENGVPVSTTVYPGTEHGIAYGDKAWPLTLRFLRDQLAAP
jgi:acetyl esterase/lipase